MVQKKVLAMVLIKYYNLQTLQNPTKFQNVRRSIRSRLARPKARPGRACDQAASWPQAAAAGGGSDRKRPSKNAPFIEKHCFRSILIISGPSRPPSRPQKWIRLEISFLKMLE